MRETGPLETDWVVISSEEATGQASLFVYFESCFETVHTIRSHNTVYLLIQDSGGSAETDVPTSSAKSKRG